MRRSCVAAAGYGVLLSLALSSTVFALEDAPARIQAGPVEIRPAASLAAVYDDNVFKVSREGAFDLEPVGDIYFTLNPRVTARFPFGTRSHLAAGYGWQAVKYTGGFGGDLDTTLWDTFDTHEVFAEADIRTNTGFSFGVRNDFQRKNLFITATELVFEEGDDLAPIGLFHNEFKPTLSYNLEDSNLQFDAGYNLSTDRFAQANYGYLDKDIHAPRGRVSYRFLPKTAGFVEGEGYLVRYHQNDSNPFIEKSDADGWKAWLGGQGAVTARMGAVLALGWGQLDYADNAIRASTWLARFEVDEKFSERTRFNIGASRNIYDSYSSNYYVSNRLYGELWHAFTPMVAGSMGGNLFRNEYSEPNERRDTGFLVSVKGQVRPLVEDWLRFNIGYNREQRRSEFDWFSYNTNQIFFELEAVL